MTRWNGGDGGAPSIEALIQSGGIAGFSTTTSDGVVNTKSSCVFGDAHPQRYIGGVVTIKGTDSLSFPNFDYMKMGGITATIAENYLVRNGSNFLWVVIGMAKVPTNSNLTFEWATDSLLNTSQTQNGCALYRCKFLQSTTPTDHQTAQNSSDTTPVPVSLNVRPRGVVIAGSITYKNTPETAGFIWSGLTSDGVIRSGASNTCSASAAHTQSLSGDSSYAASVNWILSNQHLLAVASFR